MKNETEYPNIIRCPNLKSLREKSEGLSIKQINELPQKSDFYSGMSKNQILAEVIRYSTNYEEQLHRLFLLCLRYSSYGGICLNQDGNCSHMAKRFISLKDEALELATRIYKNWQSVFTGASEDPELF